MEANRITDDEIASPLKAEPVLFLGRVGSQEMVEVSEIECLVSPEGHIGFPLHDLAKLALAEGNDSVLWVRPPAQEESDSRQMFNLVNGAVSIDLDARELSIDGILIPLQPKGFKVLEYLSTNIGIALTRQQIIDACWGDWYGCGNVVDVNIGCLRKKLGRYRPLIQTKRGYGYLMQDMPKLKPAS